MAVNKRQTKKPRGKAKKKQPVQLVTASITRHQYVSFEEIFTSLSDDQRLAVQQIARRILTLADQQLAQSA